jgi:hypothetical protein
MKEGLDFNDMKAIDSIVKMNPDKRQNRIGQLINRLRNQQNVLDELNKWDMGIERDLVTLQGEILKKAEICFADGVIFRIYKNLFINAFVYIILSSIKMIPIAKIGIIR